MKFIKKHWPYLILLGFVGLAFYPSLVFKKVPLNGNNLVSFFSPWIYQKWDGYPAGVPAKPGILDQLRIYYPYMHLTQESYKLGQIPLWNPYNFAGNPHMAEWQCGVFYPLHIFLPFMSLPTYWTFYQMVGIFLAGFFTYLYLRNLKLDKLPSLLGSLTFAFSSFMFTWNAEVVVTPHSILWLPAMLLLVDKYLKKPKNKYWLMLIGCGVASVFSGYWQTTFYVFGAVALYILFRRPNLKQAISLLSTFPLIALLTSFHLLPTAELYSRSSRPIINLRPELQEFIQKYLLKAEHLITLIAPDYFGHPTTRNNFSRSNGTYYEWVIFVGTVQIILLPFLKLLKNKKFARLSTTLFLFAIITASLSFDMFHSRLVYDIKLPVLSTGIANRILFLPAFCISVLSSIALQSWIKASKAARLKATKITIILATTVFAALWIFNLKIAPDLQITNNRFPDDWSQVATRNSVIPTAVFLSAAILLLIGAKKPKYAVTAAFLLVMGATLQNVYQFDKFTPFTETRFIYPQTSTIKYLQDNAGINRYLGYNGVFMQYNFATQLNMFTAEGYDSLNDLRRTQLFQAALNKGELGNNMARSADVVIDRNLTNPYITRLMSLIGVKYLVDHSEYIDVYNKETYPTLPAHKQKLVFEDGDWKVYQYLEALPRVFLAGEYLLETDDQKTIDLIYDPKIDLRQTLILNSVPVGISPQIDPQAQVEVVSYTPNKITFKTQSSQDQLLFLSDTYYPGWRAKVDGQKSQVLAADYAFRAVPVPAGNHIIEMYYLPQSFLTGLYIATGTLVLIILITIASKSKRGIRKN